MLTRDIDGDTSRRGRRARARRLHIEAERYALARLIADELVTREELEALLAAVAPENPEHWLGPLLLRTGHLSEERATWFFERRRLALACFRARTLEPTAGAGRVTIRDLLANPPALDRDEPPGTIDPAGSLAERLEEGPVWGYEVTATLGRGGQAVVYRARHLLTGKEVALKVAPVSFERNRIVPEALAFARLRHENIIPIFDFGGSRCYHYIALELLDGEMMDATLERTGPLGERDALDCARQVAAALAEAARCEVVHGDVKPANIFRAADGRIRLGDFGAAERLDNRTKLPLAGSPIYLAPERTRGRVDPRGDLYSLGITLFELLTGGPPMPDTEHEAALRWHHTEALPHPETRGAPISDRLWRILKRLAARRPDDRFRSARALLHALGGAA